MRLFFLLLFPYWVVAQPSSLEQLEYQLSALEERKADLLADIESAKLEHLIKDLNENGLPALEEGEELIQHSAMCLVYDEQHEQAKWVAHIITSDIISGQVGRTNDFREDILVKTGTAVEKDYFLKTMQANGEYKYDGFGYDRGHLAPSADFRWSEKALSESYFYSNMSPQAAAFNRERWGELEGALRAYIYQNPTTQLYVCTGGVLKDDLPVIERSINKVSIPEQFWKVAIDLENKRGIAFLMPNKALEYPIESYARSIDEIEDLTGYDFYSNLPDEVEVNLEKQNNVAEWLTSGDIPPIPMKNLPTRHYNTVVAKKIAGTGNKVTVCGTVVSARRSRKGNILLNLDKQYPNQIFTVFIRKEDVINFPYDPVEALQGKVIYVSSKVEKMGNTPAMYIDKSEQIKVQ